MTPTKPLDPKISRTKRESGALKQLLSDEGVLSLISAMYETFNLPGAAFFSRALQRRVSRKANEAREIWLEETRLAKPRSVDIPEEDAAAIAQAYLRAAIEGAARENLRLLAAIGAGKNVERPVLADEFNYYVNILAPLRHDEIALLAEILRTEKATSSKSKSGGERRRGNEEAKQELVIRRKIFQTAAHFDAVAGSLQRTGLIVSYPLQVPTPIAGVVFESTVLLDQINQLADLDAALSAEAAGSN
ncbi:MAG: hypothetical protein ACN6O5_15140 [Achromobacter sp.]|uniref:hypothetical protein n=1 Tax=Achromobacter sp. TaxID=134375 RepID=UPI003D01F272